MVTLRCTVKALKRFKLTAEEEPPESDGMLGDWYVDLLNFRRLRLVVCVSAKSLLPVLIPARRGEFPERVEDHIAEMLREIGVTEDAAAREASAAGEVRFARTQSRSLLGVMNEYKFLGQHYLEYVPPLGAALQLAETPMSPIGMESPDRLTRQMLT